MGDSKKLQVMSARLKESIITSLRSGDIVTRFSPHQFLVLYLAKDPKTASIIEKRIRNAFIKGHSSWDRNLVVNNEPLDSFDANIK